MESKNLFNLDDEANMDNNLLFSEEDKQNYEPIHVIKQIEEEDVEFLQL